MRVGMKMDEFRHSVLVLAPASEDAEQLYDTKVSIKNTAHGRVYRTLGVI